VSVSATDVIVARASQGRVDDDLRGMLWWSAGGHVVLFAVVLLWISNVGTQAPVEVMMVNLSAGVTGPRSGGQTQIGARAVQEAAPPDTRPAPITPPAPVQPPMTVPTETARPTPPRPRPERAPEQAPARRPSTGREVVEGNARAETTVERGTGFGLSSGGGVGGAVSVDVVNFCCQGYLDTMSGVIQRGWEQNQGVTGSTTIRFTIRRDGSVQSPSVEISSGFPLLDNNALRAVQRAQLPPLPGEFTNPTLTVHLRFEYQR